MKLKTTITKNVSGVKTKLEATDNEKPVSYIDVPVMYFSQITRLIEQISSNIMTYTDDATVVITTQIPEK